MTKHILAAVMLLAACHERGRPPAPTREQSDQLNEMEGALNSMDNEEGPEQRGNPSK